MTMRRIVAGALLAAATPLAAKVIGTMTTAPSLDMARVATLPPGERTAWTRYLARSATRMAADKAALAAERRGLATIPDGPAHGPSGGGGMPMDRAAPWYAGPQARAIADTIVSFQTPAGGWGKNMDRAGPPRRRGQSHVVIETLPANARDDIKADAAWRYVGTIDNNATIDEIRFLARVATARGPGAGGAPYRAAALKGLRYLLDAQFPNGGWPQVYPLQGGYHDAVTYNDGAVSQAAMVMLDAGTRRGDFAFVPAPLATQAAGAAGRARDLIVRTQVVIDGRRTIWGQQHDALTLAPVGARNFEPAALSSGESADLLAFLMAQPDRSPAVRAAVRDGVAWIAAHALHDVAWTRPDGGDGRRLVRAPGAPPLWARFYDLRTQTPVFGDRDRTIHDDANALSRERRDGYGWFSTAPGKVVQAYRRFAATDAPRR